MRLSQINTDVDSIHTASHSTANIVSLLECYK